MNEAVLIPLHGRREIIRAYVVVDAEDADRLNQRRWVLNNSGKGYAIRTALVDGKPKGFLMHREVLRIDRDDPRDVDHLNGDSLDNRKVNLMAVPHAANLGNQRSQERGASKLRGVQRAAYGDGWVAKVKLSGRTRQLGTFSTEESASLAVRKWWMEQLPHLANGIPPIIDRGGLRVLQAPAKNAHARRFTDLTDVLQGGDRDGPYLSIPLYRRDGSVRYRTLIDPADGPAVLKWRWYTMAAGVNGSHPYAVRPYQVGGKSRHIAMHRELLGLPPAARGGPQADHINRDTLDNRRGNLRIATPSENCRNRRTSRIFVWGD